MYRVLVLLCFLCVGNVANAHQPVFPEPVSSSDQIEIDQPELSVAHYGELTGYPHVYTFTLDTPLDFFTEVLLPDSDTDHPLPNVLVLKQEQRGVSQVARLKGNQATWETFYEPFGGDNYQRGGSFKGTLEAGTYLLEVSSLENTGKYVLVVGTKEEFSLSEYGKSLIGVYRVKLFFGKSRVSVTQSPFVYVPILLFLLLGIGLWYFKRKLYA